MFVFSFSARDHSCVTFAIGPLLKQLFFCLNTFYLSFYGKTYELTICKYKSSSVY